jgi:tetratricopeptide (TPR) repeat protein
MRLSAASFAFSLVLGAGTLHAQRRDDQNATQYAAAIARGHAAAMSRSYDAALTAYREAARLQSSKGEPHYYIACVLRLQGDSAGAIAAFQTAAQNAASGEDDIRAKALMALSFARETGELPPARDSWNEYVRFADGHARVPTYTATARGRVEAIDKVTQLAEQYRAVRERIAARERENARGGRNR